MAGLALRREQRLDVAGKSTTRARSRRHRLRRNPTSSSCPQQTSCCLRALGRSRRPRFRCRSYRRRPCCSRPPSTAWARWSRHRCSGWRCLSSLGPKTCPVHAESTEAIARAPRPFDKDCTLERSRMSTSGRHYSRRLRQRRESFLLRRAKAPRWRCLQRSRSSFVALSARGIQCAASACEEPFEKPSRSVAAAEDPRRAEALGAKWSRTCRKVRVSSPERRSNDEYDRRQAELVLAR